MIDDSILYNMSIKMPKRVKAGIAADVWSVFNFSV